MDWKDLLRRAETGEEREEIVRIAIMIGASKDEIDRELEALDVQTATKAEPK